MTAGVDEVGAGRTPRLSLCQQAGSLHEVAVSPIASTVWQEATIAASWYALLVPTIPATSARLKIQGRLHSTKSHLAYTTVLLACLTPIKVILRPEERPVGLELEHLDVHAGCTFVQHNLKICARSQLQRWKLLGTLSILTLPRGRLKSIAGRPRCRKRDLPAQHSRYREAYGGDMAAA